MVMTTGFGRPVNKPLIMHGDLENWFNVKEASVVLTCLTEIESVDPATLLYSACVRLLSELVM